jgi:hypothetical protein
MGKRNFGSRFGLAYRMFRLGEERALKKLDLRCSPLKGHFNLKD